MNTTESMIQNITFDIIIQIIKLYHFIYYFKNNILNIILDIEMLK